MKKKKKRLSRRQRKRLALFIVEVLSVFILLVFLLSLAFCHKTEQPPAVQAEPEQISEQVPEQAETPVVPEGYKYITMSASDSRRGSLILVNGQHPYSFMYNSSAVFVKLKDTKFEKMHIESKQMFLNETAADALYLLAKDFYEATGVDTLDIISAGRTYEDQKSILDARIKRDGEEKALQYVALPGFSEHNSGLSVDLAVYLGDDGWGTFYGTDEFEWIAENAYKYGFFLRYPKDKTEITKTAYESWHYRYVGVPHAYYIYNNGICFEEYIDLLRTTSFENRLKISCDGSDYEVWFSPEMEFLVPTNFEYSVSGNNVDGYIITEKIN